jgi:uncharacterized membrane protein
MLKMKALIAASLLLGTPALAQQAPAMSDAGRQVFKENIQKRDTELAPLIAKRRELQKRYDALLTPEGYDEEKLAWVMAEMRGLEGEIVERTGVSMLALLKALPDGDRTVFFRSLKRPGQASRPVPKGDTGR